MYLPVTEVLAKNDFGRVYLGPIIHNINLNYIVRSPIF